MASQTPYARLAGTWIFYLAPVGTAKPDLYTAPAGDWVRLGATEGEQAMTLNGSLTALMDNEATGPRKHIRPEEGLTIEATLANLTLEDRAMVRSMAASDVVTATASGGADVKRLPNRRGYIPTRYALLARGGAVEAANTMSPYGAWPAQLWVPMGVFDGEPSEAYSKDGSPAVEFEFKAEWDSSQAAGEEFGYLEVQHEAE